MPLQVRISINGREIKTLHIGRIEGDMNPDTINTYVAVWDTYAGTPDWTAPDGTFRHRYGDPVEVCVAKALDSVGSLE